MAYFEKPAYDTLTDPLAKKVYDEIRQELGFGIVPNLFKSMAIRPAFLEAQWLMFKSTILQGHLPRTLKEMIGVAIAQERGCEYVLKVHLHGLSALGMSEDVLQTLISDFESCPLPKREKAVIRFGLLAGTAPQKLTKDHYQELKDLGLDMEEIFEIVATATLFSGLTHYTDSISLEIDKL